MADYPTKGSVLQVSIASTYTAIGQVQTIGSVGGSAGKRDVTHLLSPTMEYRPAIFDPAELTFSVIYNPSDQGIAYCQTQVVNASTVDAFKVIFATTTKFAGFTGYVSKVELKGADVQGTWMADLTLQVATTIVWPTT